MIDHITILVLDLINSKTFYERTFMPLGYKIAFGEEGKFWAFGLDKGTLFEIAQSEGTIHLTPCHIAFRVKSQEQVKQFYEAALAAGGKCNGAPGPRPQYTESYYAAFIIDPSGHNIEAVFDSKNT